jgi:hypothetical protein
MTAKVGAMGSGKSLGRTLSLVVGGVLALVAVAACGGGGTGTKTDAKDGFNQAPLTVWVESTRLLAVFRFSQRFLVAGMLAGATKS